MDSSIFGIDHFDAYAVLGILLFFAIVEIIAGFWKNSKRTSSDWIQEAGGFIVLTGLIKPAIVLLVLSVGNLFFPTYSTTLHSLQVGWAFLIFILVDDILQYWYHRSAHEYEWLWKLHRPHHQAEEMGFFVSYRNAGLYYLFMPNIWWIGIFTFLGGGKAVAIGLILKQLIIIGSHSPTKWDQWMYQVKFLSPVVSIIERIIITPAFHFAHHGKSKADGISDPNGNFGNMFSIWDQLFGSALFTRKYPTDFGLENDPKEHWTASYFYPFIKSKDKNSELSKGYKKDLTVRDEPSKVKLEAGKKYLWCQCGKSKSQPFCDGSHHGSKHKPILFEVEKDCTKSLCNCKRTKTGPFCDGSHLK